MDAPEILSSFHLGCDRAAGSSHCRRFMFGLLEQPLAAFQTEMEGRFKGERKGSVEGEPHSDVGRALAFSASQVWQRCGRVMRGALWRAQTGELGIGDCLAKIGGRMAMRQTARKHPLGCLSANLIKWGPGHLFDGALGAMHVAERLDGIPVYAVCNSVNDFALISDLKNQRSVCVFCFRKIDAEALLHQVRDREPGLGRGAKVVAISLHKVYKLSTEGIAFRFLPDPQQVNNAFKIHAKELDAKMLFDGVPVFQSNNLILRQKDRRFCPIFFCKEDLERALQSAFKQQEKVNPSLRVNTDIQVGSLENVLKRMESSDDGFLWKDAVFIPPGMEAISQLESTLAHLPTGMAVIA